MPIQHSPHKINRTIDNAADKLGALDDVDPCSPEYVVILRNQVISLTGTIRAILERTVHKPAD